MPINVSTVLIKATAEKVWDAITKPEAVKHWQYGSDVATDWQPRSSIRFTTGWEGKVFEQWGTVLEMAPNRLVRYNLFAPRPDLEDLPENYFIMSYELTPVNNATLLTITQDDNRPGAVQEAPQNEENPVLAALKAYAES